MSKAVVHNIVTFFVVHNVIHNTELRPFQAIMNDKISQFCTMNDVVNDKNHNIVYNLIQTAWAKLRKQLC